MFRYLECVNFEAVFFSFISLFIFWVVTSELSYFLSKFTTVGNSSKFGDLVFWIEDIVKFKFKKPKLANWILNASYSKAFVCYPCHSFWICFFVHWVTFSFWYALLVALLTYGIIKYYAKAQN
jgi:hypothetical protein